jgi:hypothetical protein
VHPIARTALGAILIGSYVKHWVTIVIDQELNRQMSVERKPAAARKPWATPRVIESEIEFATRTNPFLPGEGALPATLSSLTS